MTRGEEPKALLLGNTKSLTKKQEKHCPLKERHVMIAGEPVLPFDNQSNSPNTTIELLTITEVADLLRISVSGARRLQQARQIPFHKIGGSLRFSKRDIASYLEKQRVGSIDT